MLGFIKCLIKRSHDWEPIPKPTNLDWEEKLPQKICLQCGKIKKTKNKKNELTRAEKAKSIYEKKLSDEAWSDYNFTGVLSPMPPGPWDNYTPLDMNKVTLK